MKSTARATKQYALLISPHMVTRGDSVTPFGRFAVRIVHFDGDKTSAPTESPFNGLVFACQWNENNPTEPTNSWKAFYHEVWKVEHADAERMVKMLRKLNRISSSASVTSFGQYVAFVASALKIKLALKESKHATGVPSYKFNEYVHIEPSEVAGVIDAVVAEVRSTGVKSAGA